MVSRGTENKSLTFLESFVHVEIGHDKRHKEAGSGPEELVVTFFKVEKGEGVLL